MIYARLKDVEEVSCEILYTSYKNHAFELAREHRDDFDTIVAVGGDGTANEVSAALVNSEACFGIIPSGSGNGLARSLDNILKRRIKSIDSGQINNKHFINIAGIGFDAEVAHAFDKQKIRGFAAYFKEVVTLYTKYKAPEMTLIINDERVLINPFLLSIANSSQWGSNAFISPIARVDDGLLDICILKKFPLAVTPVLAGRLFLKSIHLSKFMDIKQVNEVKIQCDYPLKGHVDGEPIMLDNIININVLEKSIKILI